MVKTLPASWPAPHLPVPAASVRRLAPRTAWSWSAFRLRIWPPSRAPAP